MKKLILVRHGKAEESVSGISDYERSLTAKGKVVSRLMAKKLRETDKSKMTLITSPAFRAIETALIFAMELDVNPDELIICRNIYVKMNRRHLQEILFLAEDKSDTVILFGHNPSFTDLANGFTDENLDYMPKSSIAGFCFDIGRWADISQKKGRMEYYLKPDKTL